VNDWWARVTDVRVVVDTSTCLEPDQADRLGITLVPLRVRVDGRDCRDMFDVTARELYEQLRRRVIPTTSAPSVGDYLRAFEASPGAVLCLTVGGPISAMDRAARLAAGASSCGPVEVVETGTAAGGLRLVALAAARLAAAGLPMENLRGLVRDISERIEMVGMLETVEFLARSGRVPGIAHRGSSALRLRPIVRFQRGRGSLTRLVRSSQRGITELHRLACAGARRQAAGPHGRGLVCTVFHGDAPEAAMELYRRLRADLPEADLSVSEMTAAMAVHVGPGVVGHALHVEPTPMCP
jgi:DegV family protein with EDD domain